ncbi:MAG: hypothetical protein LBE70_02200 [Nitrososphaerota archaeon]|nr:hypothetical protein [Nitrososphaerota archaeon]
MSTKQVVPAEFKRRGNPGYGQVKALRILVCPTERLDNDTRIIEYLYGNIGLQLKHLDYIVVYT